MFYILTLILISSLKLKKCWLRFVFKTRKRPFNVAGSSNLTALSDLRRGGGVVWKVFNGKVFLVGIISNRTNEQPFVAQRISAVKRFLRNNQINCIFVLCVSNEQSISFFLRKRYSVIFFTLKKIFSSRITSFQISKNVALLFIKKLHLWSSLRFGYPSMLKKDFVLVRFFEF